MQVNTNGWIEPELNMQDIKGFRMLRSIVNKQFFNVYAVDKKNKPLVTMAVNLSYEDAEFMTQTLNAPYEDEVEYTEFKTEEVIMSDGSKRYFQVQA